MKPNRGCLELLFTPVSAAGPIAAFLVGHYGVIRIYASAFGGHRWPQTLPARITLVISGLLLASFTSMILWQLASRLLGEGFGELDEPALSKRARDITRMLGILGLIALGIAALLIHLEPEPKRPAFSTCHFVSMPGEGC